MSAFREKKGPGGTREVHFSVLLGLHALKKPEEREGRSFLRIHIEKGGRQSRRLLLGTLEVHERWKGNLLEKDKICPRGTSGMASKRHLSGVFKQGGGK